MNSTDRQQDEVIRLTEWIADNPDVWERVCAPQDEMDAEEVLALIGELQACELYSAIVFLLGSNRHDLVVSKALGRLYLHCLAAELRKTGAPALVERVKTLLQDEINTVEGGEDAE